MKTLILGLGNPILRDEAAGMVVAREVHKIVAGPDIDVLEASVAGMELMDIMSGYGRVIIVDAIKTVGGHVGDLYEIAPADIETTPRLASPHDVDFGLVMKLGELLGQDMPKNVKIYAVEVADPYTFGEELTPEVARRIPDIVREIADKEFPKQPGSPCRQGRQDE